MSSRAAWYQQLAQHWLSRRNAKRSRRDNRRHTGLRRPATSHRCEPLEPRVLLAAQVVDPIPDLSVATQPVMIDLLDHLNDTAVDGTVLHFDTVPLAVDDDGDMVADRFVEDWFAELFDDVVPNTVANFLDYVNSGAFADSFIHRSLPGFVIQGGAFTEADDEFPVENITTNDPVDNEFANHAIVSGTNAAITAASPLVQLPGGTDLSGVEVGDRIRLIGRTDGVEDSTGAATDFFNIIGVDDAANTVTISPTPSMGGQQGIDWFITSDVNVRGTLSPPKLGGDPDSATSGFFVNLANNASNLDVQNQGFAAFGQVLFDGMDVVDALADLPRINAGAGFETLPVNKLQDITNIGPNDLALFNDITVVPEMTFEVVNNSNPDAVSATVQGGQLTVQPQGGSLGETATITVRGTDLQGNIVENTFDVTVNSPPTVATPIPDVQVTAGSADTVIQDVADSFTDADFGTGDTLTITLQGNTNPGLVTATLEGDDLRLAYEPGMGGVSTVTLRATDSFGAFVEQDIEVMVTGGVATPVVTMPIDNVNVGANATPVVIDLSTIFTDSDPGDLLTFTVQSNTTGGLIDASINADDLTLTISPNSIGQGDITIRATDTTDRFAEDTFTVTVNNPPTVAVPVGQVTVEENAADTLIQGISGVFNDSNLNQGDTLTLTIEGNTNPDLVTAMIEGDALRLSYAADMTGTASITLRATDSLGAFVDTQVPVNVADVNDTPVVVAPIADVQADEDDDPIVIDLSGVFDDADLPGDTLTYTVTGNTNGQLVTTMIDGDELTLTLAENASGNATLTVRATDAEGAFVEDTFELTVDAVDDPVIAADDVDDTLVNQPVVINVLANDADVDGTLNPSSVMIGMAPQNGQVQLNPVTGAITYTPNTDFEGQDTFTYKVSNTTGQTSNTATVTIDVISGTLIGSAEGRDRVDVTLGGVDVTVRITGDGRADVFDVGNGMFDIELIGGDDRTTVTVTTGRGQTATMRNFTTTGSLRAINARSTDLAGDIEVGGTVGLINMNDVDGPSTLTVGPADRDGADVDLMLARVTDLSINSQTPLGRVIVTDWTDTDPTTNADTITAPAIQQLQSRGDRRAGLPGDFDANLMLTGSDDPRVRATLQTARIGGDVDGTTWSIVGDANAIQIDEDVTGWTLDVDRREANTPVDVRTIRLGDVSGTTMMFEGDVATLQASEWHGGGNNALTADSIRTLNITGDRRDAAVPGRFSADLTLTGSDNDRVRDALGRARIAGEVDGAVWMITGDTSAVQIDGPLDNSTLSFGGDVRSLRLGVISDTSITAADGDINALQASQWFGGALTAMSLGRLNIVGDRRDPTVNGTFVVDVDLTSSDDPRVRQTLGNVRIVGPVTGLSAMTGTTWDVDGEVGSLFLGDVVSDWTLNVTDGDVRSMRLGRVEDTVMDIDGDVRSLSAICWIVTAEPGAEASLTADTLGVLRMTGDRRNDVPGDWSADLTLTGDPDARDALRNASVSGFLGGLWDVIGGVGNITADEINTFTAAITGDLRGLISRGDVLNSTILAHTINTVNIRENLAGSSIAAGGDFDAAGITETSIRSFRVGGDIRPLVIGNDPPIPTNIFVGLDNGDGIFGNGDDILIGGPNHSFNTISVNGTVSDDTLFAAGEFPRTVTINRERIDPLMDDRFELTLV